MLRVGSILGIVAVQGVRLEQRESVDLTETKVGHSSAPYDPAEGLKFAWLTMAAYCGSPKLPDGRALRAWQCGPSCDNVPGVTDVRTMHTRQWDDNAYAYAGKLDGKCVVGFRGTSETWGWINDLSSAVSVDPNRYGVPCYFDGEPCGVGYGWMLNYEHIQKDLIGNMTEMGCLDMPVQLTGHSLGGTVGLLAAMDLFDAGFNIIDIYTYGSPRVGDHRFVKAFKRDMPDTRIFRVTNCKDIVPHVPPTWLHYEHIGTEVYYECNDPTWSHYRVCEGTEDPYCSDQWDMVEGLIGLLADCVGDIMNCDHLTYFRDITTWSMAGQSCHDPWLTTTPQPGTSATCGGTAEGARCMFPFQYGDTMYESCTKSGSYYRWCYTDSEDKWGYCHCD